MVGERPPSRDLVFGWWFAGAGYDGSGSGDIVMGARDVGWGDYVIESYPRCRGQLKFGLHPGQINNDCDVTHFWSLHSGGSNFVMGDGSVRFISHSGDRVLPALMSRNGGEVVSNEF
jgi:prepilin-type processing-associated H-X9-DG protein